MAPVASIGIDDGWVAADGAAEIVCGKQALELNRRAVAAYIAEEGRCSVVERPLDPLASGNESFSEVSHRTPQPPRQRRPFR